MIKYITTIPEIEKIEYQTIVELRDVGMALVTGQYSITKKYNLPLKKFETSSQVLLQKKLIYEF